MALGGGSASAINAFLQAAAANRRPTFGQQRLASYADQALQDQARERQNAFAAEQAEADRVARAKAVADEREYRTNEMAAQEAARAAAAEAERNYEMSQADAALTAAGVSAPGAGKYAPDIIRYFREKEAEKARAEARAALERSQSEAQAAQADAEKRALAGLVQPEVDPVTSVAPVRVPMAAASGPSERPATITDVLARTGRMGGVPLDIFSQAVDAVAAAQRESRLGVPDAPKPADPGSQPLSPEVIRALAALRGINLPGDSPILGAGITLDKFGSVFPPQPKETGGISPSRAIDLRLGQIDAELDVARANLRSALQAKASDAAIINPDAVNAAIADAQGRVDALLKTRGEIASGASAGQPAAGQKNARIDELDPDLRADYDAMTDAEKAEFLRQMGW